MKTFRRFRSRPDVDLEALDLAQFVRPLVALYLLDLARLQLVLQEAREMAVRLAELDRGEESKLPARSDLIVDVERQLRERRAGLAILEQLADVLHNPGDDAGERLAALAPELERRFGGNRL